MSTDFGLPAFLEARWAEEADIAQRAAPGPWEFSDRGWQLRLTADAPNFERVAMVDQPSEAQWWAIRHAAGWDPSRVLAEVDAKRRILAYHEPEFSKISDYSDCANCIDDGRQYDSYPCHTVRLLALPYAGHPAYRQEWAP